MSVGQIETLCANYDGECATLEEQIAALEADLEAVKQKHLRGLKKQAAVVAVAEAELHGAVESAPQLFVKPRTLTVHGVKVGFTSSVGKLTWECEDETVIAAIRRIYGRSAGDYIRTKEEPNKDAIKLLPAEELKKIGCAIEGAGDVVICKRVAGDVEKLVNKLIEKLVEAMVDKD